MHLKERRLQFCVMDQPPILSFANGCHLLPSRSIQNLPSRSIQSPISGTRIFSVLPSQPNSIAAHSCHANPLFRCYSISQQLLAIVRHCQPLLDFVSHCQPFQLLLFFLVLLITSGYIEVLLGTLRYFQMLSGTSRYVEALQGTLRHVCVILGTLRYIQEL